MKLKKIAALCKKEKRATIYQQWEHQDGIGRTMVKQFISNGYAVYAAHGLPPLEKESLLRIFDAEENKFDQWTVSTQDLPEAVSLSDCEKTEREITGGFPSLFLNEEAVQAFGTAEGGIIFIRDELLGPLDGETDLQFYIRDSGSGGMQYLAVKSGLFLLAVILQKRLITPRFLEELKELTCRAEKQRIQDAMPSYSVTLDAMEDSLSIGNPWWRKSMGPPEEKPEEDPEEQLTVTPGEGNP